MPSKLNSDSYIPIARNSNRNQPIIENNIILIIVHSDNSIVSGLIFSTKKNKRPVKKFRPKKLMISNDNDSTLIVYQNLSIKRDNVALIVGCTGGLADILRNTERESPVLCLQILILPLRLYLV